MPEHDVDRRSYLQLTATILLAFAGGCATQTTPLSSKDLGMNTGNTTGKPGDFNFLAGNWKIKHKRLTTPHTSEWEEFEGEATCWTILGGVGSVEELRIPSRNFSGMGLRLLDVQKGIWSDFWVNAKSGVLATPGQTGNFENGVGTFTADDKDGEKPIKVKGVWDRITTTSCRWWQSVSWDGGTTWEDNWYMDWTRA